MLSVPQAVYFWTPAEGPVVVISQGMGTDLEAWLKARTEAELMTFVQGLSNNALRVLIDSFGVDPECDCCRCGDPFCNCSPPTARRSWYLPWQVELYILQRIRRMDFVEPTPEDWAAAVPGRVDSPERRAARS